MDGSLRIQQTESPRIVSRSGKSGDERKRRPFNPEELLAEEQTPPATSSDDHSTIIPIGHKLDDESGSHLDLTA